MNISECLAGQQLGSRCSDSKMILRHGCESYVIRKLRFEQNQVEASQTCLDSQLEPPSQCIDGFLLPKFDTDCKLRTISTF